MAITQTTYTGNGSTTNYSFTFEYLKQADVKVTLNTVATTAFTFANATTLAFTTAPASGVAIRIFRDTAIDNLSATFFPGSAIKAEDLNENFTQNLYVTQESDFEVDTANTTANTAKTTADTALTNSTTAISTANSATTTANTAITTSNSATTTANAATTTANTASTNASSAVTTANTASTNATAAVNTANTASTNASAAVTTANSAQADATTAISTANSATATANSATTTANSAVTTANTANTNATAAQTAATNAQASATAAQTSATAAQTSATAAQAQATLAADVRNAFTVTDSNSDGTFDFVVGDIPIKGNAGVKLPFESVTYAEEGAIRYNNSLDKIELYNGAGQWVTAGGGASVSSTPPTLPSAGDVWYDHDNGRAYVYYNDGDSNQWVEMNPSWNGYVADNSVTSAKIVDGTIVNADVNASAAIAQSKLALDITNSEVNASAAIAGTKISPNFGSQNVLTTGSVGVGTASPDSTLELAAGPPRLKLTRNTTANTGNDFGRIVFENSVGTILSRIDCESTSGNTQSALTFSNGGSERLRISSDGKVGIGTSSPVKQLHIHNSSATEAQIQLTDSGTGSTTSDGMRVGWNGTLGQIYVYENADLRFATNASERMRIDSSGRLLLGLTSSIGGGALLQVQGSGNRKAHFHQPDTGSCIIQFTNSVTGTATTDGLIVGLDSTEDGLIFVQEAKTLNFGTNNTERMRIDSSGLVGIGTSSPSSKLHIAETNGNAKLTLQRTNSASNTNDYGSILWKSTGGNNNGLIGVARDTGEDNGYMFFSTASGGSLSERMRILSSGGLTFNGDTDTANALDDYEEGTWSPTAIGYSGTMTVQAATYRKVGSLCFVHTYVSFNNTTDSSGVEIGGLPFTAGGTTSHYYIISAQTNGGLQEFHLRGQGTSTSLTAVHLSGANGDAKPTYTNFALKWIMISGCFITT
jgi:hypothetical protein